MTLKASVLLAAAVLATAAQAQQSTVPMDPKADPNWEVATVKPSDSADTRGQHIDREGRRILFLDTTVRDFLLLGYGVHESQLANLPDWANTEKWDIVGVPDREGMPSLPQLQSLLRKILPERFGLQLHHEQRPMSIIAMTVAKGGPKLTLNTTAPDDMLRQHNGTVSGVHTEELKNTSMSDLAFIIQFRADRPVIDQTNLKGRYDFKLAWTLDDAPNPPADAPPGLFTAIQEQIGLKLDRVKEPADTLVIDHLEKPGAN